MSGKENLTELHVNLLGKLTLAAMGAWMVGKMTNIKFRGSASDVKTVANALMASRRFQDELRRPGATVDSVMRKLGVKNMTARDFERTFGIAWPL